MNIPDHVFDMYRDRISSIRGLLEKAIDDESELSSSDLSTINTLVHKIAGIASFFDDNDVQKESSKLDNYLRHIKEGPP